MTWPACDKCGSSTCTGGCREPAEPENLLGEEVEDDDPECTCEQVDVDLFDSRHCRAHGPDSALARRNREAEAAQEAAFWQGIAEF